ncbi:BsuBI/PstI family type II restriction endonuclease [Dictyobacter kobayashii]|uniref:BsuBI/PstI restriction endonuclease domain-containing protein n=1 Tax=Dictyobacter kobayashii TaxID=2014872 RepID=A0A402AEB4_9CHLR|nr:BsuBI/PstI family type II restriction endonuclease [Dictyobacter kobayashii]GCE17467.1 hypothetical protein KDK_12670 [Dictyobacter kobayashii]
MQPIHQTTLKKLDGAHFFFASPGPARHNSLLVDTIELFVPRYVPNAYLLHLQDQANTIAIFEREQLQQLGVANVHPSDLPDILLYQAKKQVLFCIDVLNRHGSISYGRKHFLEQLMLACPLRRIYISSCYDFHDYKQIASQIAWGTYTWLAHAPEHIIFHW